MKGVKKKGAIDAGRRLLSLLGTSRREKLAWPSFRDWYDGDGHRTPLPNDLCTDFFYLYRILFYFSPSFFPVRHVLSMGTIFHRWFKREERRIAWNLTLVTSSVCFFFFYIKNNKIHRLIYKRKKKKIVQFKKIEGCHFSCFHVKI